MKRTISILAALAAFAVLADQYIFSTDGMTAGSSPRELPTQGVSLSSGVVVVGLGVVDVARRVDCGWYKYSAGQKPEAHSNEVWRIDGYTFDATNGTATAKYKCVWIKPKPKTYSKIRLKIAIAKIGKLEALEAWLKSFDVESGYSAYEAWIDAQEIADDFEGFGEFREAAKTALGVTEEQAVAILKAAEVKK